MEEALGEEDPLLGTGDLEITLRSVEDLEKAASLLLKSYESS